METDKQLSRRDFLKIVGGTAVVVVTGAAIAEEALGETPQDLVPEYSFVPFALPPEAQGQALPTPQTIVEFPKPKTEPKLSPAEIREAQIKRELKNIQKIMKGRPDLFSPKKIADVGIYYPIYRAVADKNKLPWYLIYLVHEAETGASAGKGGYVPGLRYQGAMQIDTETWSEEYMDKAAKGLKSLSKLPQRHPDDWRNIATGAKILGTNFKKYRKLGVDKAVLNALILYSADNQALKRFKTFQEYERVFPAIKKKKSNTRVTALQRAS